MLVKNTRGIRRVISISKIRKIKLIIKKWRDVIPKIIVNNKLFFLSLKFLLSIEWWDHVSPEETKIIVFINGISNGLKGWIP